MARFALYRKKERWTATWLGQVLKIIIILGLIFIYAKTIHAFLAPTDPVNSKVMIVEGFIPDYALEEAADIFNKGQYKLMIITGKKRMKGAPLDQYKNDGIYSAATLIKLGFDSTRIRVVAVENEIKRDRTFTSALAAKKWIENHNEGCTSFNLVTLDCHARRSRLLFGKAFGEKYRVGIIAIRDRSYNADHWWQTSNGFREVIQETIAWIYARFFFWPDK